MKKSDLINLLGKVTKEDEVLTNPHERVLLIDGLNLFFRNFAMMKMVNQDGAHVGGLGGFLRSLNYLVNQLQPTSVYVVFDGAGSSINRKNLLPEYKSGRNLVRITNWDVFDSLEEEHDSKVNQTVRLIHYLKWPKSQAGFKKGAPIGKASYAKRQFLNSWLIQMEKSMIY